MPLTREQRKEAFEHVIDKVLDLKNTPLDKVLRIQGVDDILRLTSMQEDQVMGLAVEEHGKMVLLPLAQRNALRVFLLFIQHCLIKDAWLTVTQDQFDEFRMSETLRIINGYGINQTDDGQWYVVNPMTILVPTNANKQTAVCNSTMEHAVADKEDPLDRCADTADGESTSDLVRAKFQTANQDKMTLLSVLEFQHDENQNEFRSKQTPKFNFDRFKRFMVDSNANKQWLWELIIDAFCAVPPKGNLELAKYVHGYPCKMEHALYCLFLNKQRIHKVHF